MFEKFLQKVGELATELNKEHSAPRADPFHHVDKPPVLYCQNCHRQFTSLEDGLCGDCKSQMWRVQ